MSGTTEEDTTPTITPEQADAAINLWDVYESDEEAEDKGRWIVIAGSGFRIRASDHPAVNKVVIAQQRRQNRIAQANGGMLPEATVEANLAEEAAAVVTDWRDVSLGRDEPNAPFTPENAIKLFSIRRMRRLRAEVLGISRTAEFFRAAAIRALEGN